MAKYGAKYLQWARFKDTTPDDSASALPLYGAPMNLGCLVKVTDSPSFNEAKQYGDNALKEYVYEFKECGVDVEVTELSATTAAALFGATIGTSPDTDLKFGSADNAPYGGLAFYICKLVDNVKKYQGVYYPKLKAAMQGEEYDTTGDGITLTGGKVKFTASAPKNGQWKIVSADLETEEAAIIWVDGKIVAGA